MMKLVALFLSLSVLSANGDHKISRELEGRIIGGKPANPAPFNFAVSILKQTTAGTFLGVGTLIDNQWILTSGKIVDGGVGFTIRVGIIGLTGNDPNVGTMHTATYFLHPQYDTTTLANDIGLIKLPLPIAFTDFIRSIRILPTLPDYSSLLTLGWAQTNFTGSIIGSTVDELRYVFLETLSDEECRLVLGNQATDNIVCGVGINNEGIYRVDIGSPLIQYDGSSLSYVVGVSTVIRSNSSNTIGPIGFTIISPYVSWINAVITTN